MLFHTRFFTSFAFAAISAGCSTGSLGSDQNTSRALDADEQALVALQSSVITSTGDRCAAARQVQRDFQTTVARGRNLNPEIVATVRASIDSLVATFCNTDDPTLATQNSWRSNDGQSDAGISDASSADAGVPDASAPSDVQITRVVVCGSRVDGSTLRAISLMSSLGLPFEYLDLNGTGNIERCQALVRSMGSEALYLPTIISTYDRVLIYGYSEDRIRDLANRVLGNNAGSTPDSEPPPVVIQPPSEPGMVSPIVLYGRPTTDALTRAAALQLDEARLTYRVCDLRYTMCLREVAELLQTSSFSVPVLQVGRLRVYPYTQSALAAAIRSYNP